jgi:hypothetical protein
VSSRAGPAEDAIDLAAHEWAAQWVAAYANGDGGQVGALTCTLAGLTPSRTPPAQHWPEVYRHAGLKVARALHSLLPADRQFLFQHYVERWYEPDPRLRRYRRRRRPVPQRAMASLMGLTHLRYLRRRDRLKRRLATWLWPPQRKTCIATSKRVLFGQVVEVSP